MILKINLKFDMYLLLNTVYDSLERGTWWEATNCVWHQPEDKHVAHDA